ncbi:hypothetical protein PLEOSDRAFT_1106360 [Pleurotus ostreatus PC15]|uniref:Uncharacterized protein n=1 Tax=Pleurotus ostreatus (strain PC15) TaxID=1137138 RepID=A0A067NP72_PLEO1|nr:hypothetical protein PLEOSDRAFT_1106360 [Pleurotus ostreatus PC15]
MAVLSTETQQIVANIHTEVHSEEPEPSNSPTLDDTQDNEMEWETLPNELNGDQLFLHNLTDALIKWKNASSMEQSSSEDNLTTNEDFDVFIIDLYTLEHTTIIHWTPDTEAAVALVRNGYISASPQAPTLAICKGNLKMADSAGLAEGESKDNE